MTTVAEVLKIIITAEDQASAAISQVGDGLESLASNAGQVIEPLANIAETILTVDAALTGLGAALGVVAVKESVAFKDSMYLVQKQLGDSSVSLQQAGADIEALALKYGTNANAIAESTAGWLAAGYDYETATQLVVTSTQLMIAGELEAVQSTDYLSASLAGWRVPAEEAAAGATKVGDILNKLADISSSRQLDPIAEAFAEVAPVAKTAGLTMEETGAIVARLVDVFQSGAVAGTALSSGLSSLAAPSKEAAEKLAEIGVSTRDASGELRQSGDILKDLAGKWASLTEAQQSEAAAIIFGKEQAAKFQVVLGDWGKSQDYLNQVLDKTTGAVGSMAKEVEAQQSLMSKSIDRSSEAWRQLIKELGDQTLDGGQLQGLVDSVAKLGEALKSTVSGGGLDPLLDLIKGQAGELSAALDKIAANFPAAFEKVNFDGIIRAFGGLGDSLGGVFDVDLTTVDGLAKAIQFVVDSGESLIDVTSGIIDGLRPFFSAIGTGIDYFNNLDASTKEAVGQMLGFSLGLSPITGALGSLGGSISAAAGSFNDIRDAVTTLTGAFPSLTSSMGAAMTTLGLGGAMLGTWAFALSENTKAWDDYQNRTQLAADATESMTDTTARAAVGLDALNGSLGTSYASMEEFNKAADSGEIVWNEASGSWVKAGEGAEILAKATEKANMYFGPFREGMSLGAEALAAMQVSSEGTAEAFQGLTKEQFDVLEATGGSAEAFEKMANGMDAASVVAEVVGTRMQTAADDTERFKTETGETVAVTRDASTGLVTYTQTGKAVAEQLDKNTDATKKAKEETDAYRLGLAEIAADIQKAQLEAFVSIKTTQLETDAERVKATFASLDTTISSTGDLLGSLFSNLVDAGSMREKFSIEEQIDLENKRRQEALDLQKELAKVEIERVKAQTEALVRGDALIQIDGAGLEPELEAFMWAVLKGIRVRANAEFTDYLLGMSVA